MSLEAVIDKCCTSLEALRQQPFPTIKGKTRHRRLRAAQKILRSLLQDGDMEVSMTHKGAVFLLGALQHGIRTRKRRTPEVCKPYVW